VISSFVIIEANRNQRLFITVQWAMDYFTKGVTYEKAERENHCIDTKLETCSGLLSHIYENNETGKFVLGKHEGTSTLSSEQMKHSPIVSLDLEGIFFGKKSESVLNSSTHPTIDGSTYVTTPLLRSQSQTSPLSKCYKEQNFSDYFFFDPQTSSESYSKDTTITLPCLVDTANKNTLKELQSNRMLSLFSHGAYANTTEAVCMKDVYGLTDCLESNPKALIPFTVRPRIWNKNNMKVSENHNSPSLYEKTSPSTTNCSIPSHMISNTPSLTFYSTNMYANWITSSTNQNWSRSTCQFQSDLFQSPQKQPQQETSSVTEDFLKKSLFSESSPFENKIKTKSNFFSNEDDFETTHEKKYAAAFQPFKVWYETQEESKDKRHCIPLKSNQHVLNESSKHRTQSPSSHKSSFHCNTDETSWKTSTHLEHSCTHFETSPVNEEILKEKPSEIEDFSSTHPESNASFLKFNSPITSGDAAFNEIAMSTHTLNTPSNKSLFKKEFQWNESCFTPTSSFTAITNDECHTQRITHSTFTSNVPMETSFQVQSGVNCRATVPSQKPTYELQKSPKETMNMSNTFQETFQCNSFSPNPTNSYTGLSKSVRFLL
jgi:hypothetical protein